MSFKLAGRAWEEDISSSQKLVLLALADTAADDGTCWPGRKYLAGKCGMTLRTLDHNLESLIKRGLLKKTLQKRENGSYRSSLYQIFPPALAEGSEKSAPGGENFTSPPVQNLPEGREKSAPLEPVFEPVFESKTTTSGSGGNDQNNPTPGMEAEGSIDPKSPAGIEEYVRLGRLYGVRGGPPTWPPNWEVKARKRITAQGGLSKLDLEQFEAWRSRDLHDKTEQGEDQSKNEGIEKIKEKYRDLPAWEKSFLKSKTLNYVPGTPPWWLRIGKAMQGEV